MVNNPAAIQEMIVQSLGQEDPLPGGNGIPLPVFLPWTEEPGRLQSLGLSGDDNDQGSFVSPHLEKWEC